MLDFDKDFEKYILNWYAQHSGEFGGLEEMENKVPDLYDEWASSPSENLGGITPKGFFDNITDPEQLVKLLIATGTTGAPCSLLLDRIEQVPECDIYLADIINSSTNKLLIMIAINLLKSIDNQLPYSQYVAWLLDWGTELALPHIDSEIIELVIEILTDKVDVIGELLLPFVAAASYETKVNLADILVSYQGNNIVFDLLVELFAIGENIPLYAGYLGKFGDDRAIPVLERSLDTCNYLEYLEVVGAIERLGGEVKLSRDFSEDHYYLALKNSK